MRWTVRTKLSLSFATIVALLVVSLVGLNYLYTQRHILRIGENNLSQSSRELNLRLLTHIEHWIGEIDSTLDPFGEELLWFRQVAAEADDATTIAEAYSEAGTLNAVLGQYGKAWYYHDQSKLWVQWDRDDIRIGRHTPDQEPAWIFSTAGPVITANVRPPDFPYPPLIPLSTLTLLENIEWERPQMLLSGNEPALEGIHWNRHQKGLYFGILFQSEPEELLVFTFPLQEILTTLFHAYADISPDAGYQIGNSAILEFPATNTTPNAPLRMLAGTTSEYLPQTWPPPSTVADLQTNQQIRTSNPVYAAAAQLLISPHYLSSGYVTRWVTVTFATRQELFKAYMGRLANDAAVFAFIYFIIGFVLWGIFSRKLVRRLTQLQQATTRLAEGELNTRVAADGSDEISDLARNFNLMAEHLESFVANLAQQERVRNELEIANQIQTSLLPPQTPQISGFDLAAICFPAHEVGGDYYDFISLNDQSLGIAVGDVSGKGVPAALLMATVRSLLRAQAVSNFAPSETLATVNHLIYADTVPTRQFVAMAYGILDTRSGVFTFSNAGQMSPVYYHATGQPPQFIPPNDFPLGIMSDIAYQTECVSIKNGDMLVLYSDGIVEAQNQHGEMYGFDRFLASIAAQKNMPAQKMVSAFMHDLNQFLNSQPPQDDITVVIIKAES